MKRFLLLFSCLLVAGLSCNEPQFDREIEVYFNDFDVAPYRGNNIDGVFLSQFDGSQVMGNFNNSGFDLTLERLPAHAFIRIRFDLYIHDTWEGNSNNSETDEVDHDAWYLEFEPEELLNPADKIIFETTFSNWICVPAWCFGQSYPNGFPHFNEARSGALVRTAPGRCLWSGSDNGTSIYKFDKTFPHTRKNTVIAFYDRLKQSEPFSHLCEESWSLDNLRVSVITIKR